MATILAEGHAARDISLEDQRAYLAQALAAMGTPPRRVLLIPPDMSRFYSGAGAITAMLYDLLHEQAQVDILPALGTHSPMTDEQIRAFFGDTIPRDRFLVHDWKHKVTHRGDVPPDLIRDWSEGKVDYNVRIEINERLSPGNYDLILSIGQIVPHEVVGMANYTKNLCVGVGGGDTINKSHFLGAVYGMERIMGQTDSPPRRLFNYGYHQFLEDLPIWFILTVMEKAPDSDRMSMRGLYIGNDDETFAAGCALSQEVNIIYPDGPQKKVVAYLPPHEFKSTWLGNKAVYRTRMMVADDGELIILAPGLREFGEDQEIDRLIRKYGYRGTATTLRQVRENADLAANLSAADHLIHGVSDDRFRITYCPGPGLTRAEVEGVGYGYGDLEAMLARYPIATLKDGPNTMPDGEDIYYVSNPSLGLWGLREQFE